MKQKIAWGVWGRAALYFSITAGALAVNDIKAFADGTLEPTPWRLAYVAGSSLVSGLVALRAYFDGSAERSKQNQSPNP
jgi:hypothetical protein